MTSAEQAYRRFIASIDVSVAGRDEHGDLRWHVECSAEANASDTLHERGIVWERQEPDDYWAVALDTAKMCLDDWRSYYPQLNGRR